MDNRIRFRLLALTLCAQMLFGCAAQHTIVVDGHEVDGRSWADAVAKIRSRAAFEMSCPSEELTIVLLLAEKNYGGYISPTPLPINVGVTGCGKRAVYLRTPTGSDFVLDSTTDLED